MCFSLETLILHDFNTLDEIGIFNPTGENSSIEILDFFVLRYFTSGVEAFDFYWYKLIVYAKLTSDKDFETPTGFFSSFWNTGENKHWIEKIPVFFCKIPVGGRTSGVNLNNFQTYFANKLHQNHILVKPSFGKIDQYSSAFYLKGTWVCEIWDLQTQMGGRFSLILVLVFSLVQY